MANAAVASIDYDRRWTDGSDATHHVEASFGVRAGSRELESDLAYTRYLGQGSYRYDFGRHHVQATGMAGGITGHAPLFERFTLGDSTTLRGWDKYDIAPAGGDRVVYSSIEYRYTGLALFLDVGSVWDANTERHVRVSTGFGFHAGPAFLVVGFPLNTDNLRAVVHDGSADPRGRDPVVAPARRAAVVLLALLAWPAVRASAQAVTVDTVGDALKIRAPGFSFLKGDPLARLKDGRSVRVELAAMVLPAPGKSPAATTRRIFALSYDLWEERFAVTAVDARSQSVSHLMLAAAEAWCVEQLADPPQRARRAGPRSAVLDSARVPHSGWRRRARIRRTRATRCRRSSTR